MDVPIQVPSTRRDERHFLRPGAGTVEFDGAQPAVAYSVGDLVAVTVAGLAVHLDGKAVDFQPGMHFDELSVQVGGCVLRGHCVVRNVHDVGHGRIELGCLFYPEPADEDRWMALLAGVQAAGAAGGSPG